MMPETQVIQDGTVEAIWGIPLYTTGCERCDRVYMLEARRVGQVCPGCALSKLSPQAALLRTEPPELLIPFEKGRAEVQDALSEYLRPVFLRPDDMSVSNLVERITPVFFPMWLSDATANGNWVGEIGYDYQVKSSQESYQGGEWQTRDVTETRINWEPRLGQVSRRYENVSAPALEEHIQLVRKIGEYDQRRAIPYETTQVRSAAIQAPDIHPENAWPLAEQGFQREIRQDCLKAAKGQHVRSFRLDADYSDIHWTMILLPVYQTVYQDDQGRPQILYINGQTGKVGGWRLASHRKGLAWAGAAVLGAVALLLLAAIAFVFGAMLPPVIALGAVLAFLGVIAVVAAIALAVWPWQWNRRQMDEYE